MKRAVLYARISGDDRGRDGRNLAGQLEMCREYALKRGYSIAAELPEDDRGASGASFELPQLNRVREMAQAHLFDVLVVREIDRLSRNLAKQLIVEDELKRGGVAIEYVLGEYPDTPEGNLLKHVRASVAEFERLKIIERMTRGRYLKAKAGNVLVSKHPPFGYFLPLSSNGKKSLLAVDQRESDVVKVIFSLFTTADDLTPPLGIRQITRKLNGMGVPTARSPIRRNTSGKWSDSAVRAILANPVYQGDWAYGKTHGCKRNPVQNHVHIRVPPIVEPDVWHQAQARLKKNRELMERNSRYDYLMGQRLRCGSCNHILRAEAQPYKSQKKDKVYLYYVCDHIHDELARCPGMRANADKVDRAVWEWVKSLLLDPSQLQKGLSSYQEDREKELGAIRSRLQAVDGLLASNQAQLDRLIDLYLAGEFERSLLVERRVRLENTIASLEQERAQIIAQIEAEALTPAQIQTIEEFAAEIRKSLDFADNDFSVQQQLVDLLSVTGRLAKEDDTLVIYAQCIIGTHTLRGRKTATCAHSSCRNPRPARRD